jgi:nucleoside-diphosphate-sugar epimerase
MSRLLIFGLGYTASRIADAVKARGWTVDATGSAGNIDFNDAATVRLVAAQATHILSSVPPLVDGDPVLRTYVDVLAGKWLGYLSSTGVYGDAGGAWVDESAPIRGRRESRNFADQDWLKRDARVFRLPGIYGPGRSALDRVTEGKAHRVNLPNQVFSRVHVDDIVSGVIAGFAAPPGAYNLADDHPCDQNAVMEAAATLLGAALPHFVLLESLSPMAQSFYRENRRVANGKAKRVLGWSPAYPDFTAGLRALRAMSSPTTATTPPAAASQDQR